MNVAEVFLLSPSYPKPTRSGCRGALQSKALLGQVAELCRRSARTSPHCSMLIYCLASWSPKKRLFWGCFPTPLFSAFRQTPSWPGLTVQGTKTTRDRRLQLLGWNQDFPPPLPKDAHKPHHCSPRDPRPAGHQKDPPTKCSQTSASSCVVYSSTQCCRVSRQMSPSSARAQFGWWLHLRGWHCPGGPASPGTALAPLLLQPHSKPDWRTDLSGRLPFFLCVPGCFQPRAKTG